MSGVPQARILIVDDERPQLKALCDTLQDCDYETVGYTSCQEALAAFRATRFDLLLSDLMMPEMDGVTLLKEALELNPDVVGIIMTGQATIDTAVEAMKAGALDYILKPFKLSAILPVLGRARMVQRLRMEKAQLMQRVFEDAKTLAATNKELEAFAHSISHDLHAPIRGIGACAQILLEEAEARLEESDRKYLRHICDHARQLGRMIDDLLRFARLGNESISKQPFNLSALIPPVLEETRRLHEGRQVEVQVAPLPDCSGDPALLRQVLVNLLSNAFKFTRGRDKALIEVGFKQQQGETVYFIRDNGAGFDMKYAGKLFGVFKRLHSAAEFEGVGVGLSLVQRIIQRHGGRVWGEGEVNKGATFYFTLSTKPERPAEISM